MAGTVASNCDAHYDVLHFLRAFDVLAGQEDQIGQPHQVVAGSYHCGVSCWRLLDR